LHNRNASLRDDLEAERVRSAKMEAALEESTNMLRETKDTIQEQKREIKQIRAHFEHYQTCVAEDRQQERKQNHSVKAELESRIRELIQQLQDERQRSQVFETKNQQTEHALVRLREEFDQVKQEHQALKLDAGRKEGALKRLESDTNAYKQQIEKLVAERDVLSTAKADLATANQLLVHDIARLKEEVSEAEDKITHLSNENKFVSQEKAVLQGQLKQIQGNR
jgi:chromosome segregation ATPase